MTVLSLTINGELRTLSAPADRRLTDMLREGFGLTGTKVGCEAGDCGLCTVLMNGQQVCACLIPVAQAEGADILTVEGLTAQPLGARLQAAFHTRGAAQCGICTPGMLIAALDLLRRVARPSRQDIEQALSGVLCRCTGYEKIIEAVLSASMMERDPEPIRQEAVGQAIGQRIPKRDGWERVNGTALYGADAAPAGAVWLRVIRSPHARAAFDIGDLTALRARHGILRVLTARDVPGENSFGIYPDLKDQPVLAETHVKYRGEAVLAVIGTRETVDGLTLMDIPITWHPLPPAEGLTAGLAADPPLHAFKPDNVLTRGRVSKGDVDAARRNAAHVAEGRTRTGFVEHAYLEPEAGYALRTGDRIEIFACTQAPAMDRDEVARVIGQPLSAVRIIPSACGGGFGGKLDVSVQPLIAIAAWLLPGVPVRMVYSRTESMAASTKRHPSDIFARASCDEAGRLVSFEMEADFNTGAYASWGPTVASRVPVHATGPYRVPHVLARSRAVYTNETPAGAFRGFGVPQAAIAQESLFDTLAERCGMDRLEFRFLNALREGDATATGHVLKASAGLAECLDALRPSWKRLLSEAEIFNAQQDRLRRGVGIACMWYGIGNTSMSNPSTMRITLDRDGTLTFWNGAVDIGQGSTTVLAQIAADALGAPVELITSVIGDTDRTADAGKTSASRQTFVSGKAAEKAGAALRAEILRLTNAGPSAMISFGKVMLVVEDQGRTATLDLASLPVQPDGAVLEGIGSFDPPTTPLDADGQGVPYATYGFAAQVASLDVDLDLATVKVRRILAAHDVGRAINPMLVEGQIQGGIAQGLGLALMEAFIPGRTENLHDYLVPTFGDMPEIEIFLVENPEPLGPSGAKGIGEPALIPTAPAIFSAIRHAVGVIPDETPLLPHRLWDLMRRGAHG